MLRYYINKEWMLSATARRVYRAAAGLSIVLFIALVALPFAAQILASVGQLFRLFVFAGIVGAATTLVAMEYFFFAFDTSSGWRKLIWFCVMMVPLLGAPLYCFTVYSRATAPTSSHSTDATAASA